jgi:hypothetical protein
MAECSIHPGSLLPGCWYCRNGISPAMQRGRIDSSPSPVSDAEAAVAVASLVSGEGDRLSPADVAGHILIVVTADSMRLSRAGLTSAQEVAVLAGVLAAATADQLGGE